jgi:hypothetical protein
MPDLTTFGKLFIVFGLVLAGIGVLMLVAGRIPVVGRLPGDIVIQRDGFTFYFPLVTSILISIVLTVILNLLWRR